MKKYLIGQKSAPLPPICLNNLGRKLQKNHCGKDETRNFASEKKTKTAKYETDNNLD